MHYLCKTRCLFAFLVVLLVPGLFVGCASMVTTTSFVGESARATPERYAFEHRVLPDLHYRSHGQFLADLAENGRPVLAKIWADLSTTLLDATELHVERPDADTTLVVLSRQPPASPLCYHIALVESAAGEMYFTQERASTGGAMFCEWFRDGRRSN